MAGETILIAEDDDGIRMVLNQALARAGYNVRATGNAATLWHWVNEGEGQLVITDVVLPDENAFDVIPKIKKIRPQLPVVIMSAENTLMTAITASEQGAYEYLPKPFDLNELITIVGRALSDSKVRKTSVQTDSDNVEGINLIGRSAAMQEIYRIIARLTRTDLTVMISGESGTGKELVARALHDHGARNKGPFVAVNMAAIPHELIESELFGHEKGAFTGANTRTAGRFEQAAGGTLFLDEIGDMPMKAQTRLLRVLQENEYTSVGGAVVIKTNVRIIAATNRDLRHHISQGLFREDLFFRLNVVPIRIPPLRERTEDIPDLVQHFFSLVAQEGLPQKSIEPAAIDAIMKHRWPGNVRELENLIRRLTVLCSEETITAQNIQHELEHSLSDQVPVAAAQDLSDYIESYLGAYFARFGDSLPPDGLYQRFISEVEHPLISATLVATHGNQIQASTLLGINRNTLRKKIKELDIEIVKGVLHSQ